MRIQNHMTSVYQNAIWQRNSDTVLEYTNLVMQEGLTVKEIADLRNVKIQEVNHIFSILKNKNPDLHAQVEKTLQVNEKKGEG